MRPLFLKWNYKSWWTATSYKHTGIIIGKLYRNNHYRGFEDVEKWKLSRELNLQPCAPHGKRLFWPRSSALVKYVQVPSGCSSWVQSNLDLTFQPASWGLHLANLVTALRLQQRHRMTLKSPNYNSNQACWFIRFQMHQISLIFIRTKLKFFEFKRKFSINPGDRLKAVCLRLPATVKLDKRFQAPLCKACSIRLGSVQGAC